MRRSRTTPAIHTQPLAHRRQGRQAQPGHALRRPRHRRRHHRNHGPRRRHLPLRRSRPHAALRSRGHASPPPTPLESPSSLSNPLHANRTTDIRVTTASPQRRTMMRYAGAARRSPLVSSDRYHPRRSPIRGDSKPMVRKAVRSRHHRSSPPAVSRCRAHAAATTSPPGASRAQLHPALPGGHSPSRSRSTRASGSSSTSIPRT